jgi:hypothetical protein
MASVGSRPWFTSEATAGDDKIACPTCNHPMQIHLDPRTLLVIAALVIVIPTATGALVWRSRRIYPGFGRWTVGTCSTRSAWYFSACEEWSPIGSPWCWQMRLRLGRAFCFSKAAGDFAACGSSGGQSASLDLLALLQSYIFGTLRTPQAIERSFGALPWGFSA